MTRESDSLDRLRINNPCKSDWETMTGNQRVRFCEGCHKNVYNFSALRRDEIEALIARFEGQLCARFERDADGAMVTETMPAAPRLISRRVSPVAAVLVTAIVGLSGNGLAMTSTASAPVAIHASSDNGARVPQPQGGTATLSGVIKDPEDAVIAEARVTLINEKTGEQAGLTFTNDEGAFNFSSLVDGVYTLHVESQGFRILQLTDKEIRAGEQARADVVLQEAAFVRGGDLAIRPQPLREMHHNSDLIVVARMVSVVPVKNWANQEMMKATLEIVSVVKGSHKRSRMTLQYQGWGQDKHIPGDAKTGDTALFFLRRTAQANSFELTDIFTERSVRKLVPADLSLYLQRLEELNAMPASKPPDAAIVEWLVRCAEHRATQWEGVDELAQTAESDTEDQSDAEKSVERDETATAPVVNNPTTANASANPSDVRTVKINSTCAKPGDEPRFGAMLSEEQKGRLKTALFNIDALTESDLQLIRLVQHWKDERFVPFLLEQLRRVEANPPRLAESLMETIGDTMGDEEVKTFAEEYNNNVSYADLDAEANADGEETEAADRKTDETETSDATSEKATDAVTARQERGAMLQRFIALVEKKRAK